MSAGRCPYCGASTSSQERDEGRCSNCLSALPSRFTTDPVASWAKPDPADRPESRPRLAREPDEDDDYSAPSRAGYERYDDPYARPTGRGDPSRWATMRNGLGLLVWSMCAIAVAAGVGVLGFFILLAASEGRPGGGEFRNLGSCGGLILVLVGGGAALMTFIGSCMCCTIPGESGGRGWAVGWLILLVAHVLLVIGQCVFQSGPRGGPIGARGAGPDVLMGGVILIGLLRLGLSFASSLCFFMVMRAAARYWGGNRLAGQFVTFLVVSWVIPLIVGLIMVFVLASTDMGRGPDGAAVMVLGNCGLLLFGVAMFFWLISLFRRLRSLIPTPGNFDRFERW